MYQLTGFIYAQKESDASLFFDEKCIQQGLDDVRRIQT